MLVPQQSAAFKNFLILAIIFLLCGAFGFIAPNFWKPESPEMLRIFSYALSMLGIVFGGVLPFFRK